tara:strand:+ start:1338 stop:2663 length:1326 start_codon:yes stop_codon:yes gene_type:complete
MESKELLQLAKEFIKTEAGKKAIGVDLDINNLKKQAKDTKEQLSPEQIENRLKPYIPVIEKYQIKGRIFDKTTSTPLSKAKIQPVLATGKQVQSDDQGQFTIELGIPILPYNQKALVQTQLLVMAKGFVPTNLEVLTSERAVKTDIKTKGLVNISRAAEQAAIEVRNQVNEKIEEAKQLAYSIPEKVVNIRRKAIYKMQNIILFKLIPLAIGLLVIFGITKLADLKKAQCPTPDQLRQAVRKRNSIVRQLNQIYAMVAVNTALAVLFNFIALKLKEVNIALAGIPTTPPIPIPLLQIQKVREVIQEFIDSNKQLNIALIVALVFLVAAIVILLLILKAIDQLVFKCAPDTQLDEINSELRELENKAKTEDAVEPTKNVNGFTLEVQTVDQNAVGNLKRRQAVGKNPQGVVIVKGDPSFSAEDTVLINELAYYIQSNDLKAF